MLGGAPLCRDEARLSALLRDHFTTVWRALRRLGVSEIAADDATQEVFIVAARRLTEVEVGRERPYLYGIALRVAANWRRAGRRSIEHCDEDTLALAAAAGPATDALLCRRHRRFQLGLRRVRPNLNPWTVRARRSHCLHSLQAFRQMRPSQLRSSQLQAR